MLAAVEQGKIGELTLRVDGTVPITAASCTLRTAAGVVLSTKDLAVPYAGAVASYSTSGPYTACVMEPLEESEEDGVSAALRAQRLRLVMQYGPPLEPVCERVDAEAETLYFQLPRSSPAPLMVLDPVLRCPVSATDSAELADGYTAEWTYSTDDGDVTTTTYWAVVLRIVPGLTLADVLDREPGFRVLTGTQSDADWQAYFLSAREEVDALLASHGQRIYCVVERSQLTPLLMQALRVVLSRARVYPKDGDPDMYYQDARKALTYLARQTLQNAYLTSGTTGTVTSTMPSRQKVVRLSR